MKQEISLMGNLKNKKKHSTAKIKCKCGRKIKLGKGPFKTHGHCVFCKLEWHRVGNHIYSHPYNPRPKLPIDKHK